MPPVVEVCRFMGNEQLALESIAGGEARVLRLDDDKTAMTFVAQHTGTVGQPREFQHLALIKIGRLHLVAKHQLTLEFALPLTAYKLPEVAEAEEACEHILCVVACCHAFAVVPPEAAQCGRTHSLSHSRKHRLGKPYEVARQSHLPPGHFFYLLF